MSATAILAPVCTLIAMALIWPQVLRVYRLDTVEGLSPLGTVYGLAGTTLWLFYGVAADVPAVIMANGAIGLALLCIGIAQVRHGVLPAAALIGGMVVIVAFGLSVVSVSTAAIGVLASVVGVTSIVPQLIHVHRSSDLSAVSRPMYALLCASCSLWVTYGLLLGDAIVIVTNALVFPCGVFIWVRATRYQTGREPDLALV